MHWRRKGFRRKYKELARIELEKGGVQISLDAALSFCYLALESKCNSHPNRR
jgi:hypothetical protein